MTARPFDVSVAARLSKHWLITAHEHLTVERRRAADESNQSLGIRGTVGEQLEITDVGFIGLSVDVTEARPLGRNRIVLAGLKLCSAQFRYLTGANIIAGGGGWSVALQR